MSKLLLLSCSQSKRTDTEELPAIERYDGPTFRVLRRYFKQDTAKPVDVVVLSAQYGLISADFPLPYYDCRMTREKARALRQSVLAELERLLGRKNYTNLLICLGKDYLVPVYGYEAIIPSEMEVQIAAGGIGRKLSILHDWLYEDFPKVRKDEIRTVPKDTAKIRGVEVCLTPAQILDVARQGISIESGRASCYQTWYVSVDEQRVALKWLVSEIAGLPVNAFATSEARRVLAQLGVEAKRV
ncbi:hypothetical protein IQ254_00050 [Nodosilinea sp. LEGE 07088]|uniref:DUF6884 domain-containing protein n=1 Tax=Nodosilinea sp. LEGE 07088 TaxID=2777968 RepID=UPI00187F0033|nr:DUF6884 domain-containing protein [Nodosilinea sp. LEGE 07088]MBE9135613.1 hypothetical protein [Nodosilinea sp. LEGE 07088]